MEAKVRVIESGYIPGEEFPEDPKQRDGEIIRIFWQYFKTLLSRLKWCKIGKHVFKFNSNCVWLIFFRILLICLLCVYKASFLGGPWFFAECYLVVLL